jgi:hypothetical protein
MQPPAVCEQPRAPCEEFRTAVSRIDAMQGEWMHAHMESTLR